MCLPAAAQDKPADPVEVALADEWQANRIGQQHLADAMVKLMDAYRKEKARADAAEAKLKQGEQAK
jgi:hypothetical protein